MRLTEPKVELLTLKNSEKSQNSIKAMNSGPISLLSFCKVKCYSKKEIRLKGGGYLSPMSYFSWTLNNIDIYDDFPHFPTFPSMLVSFSLIFNQFNSHNS